ncbi:CP26A protein, partial [Polypterus senegalus]|nr:CP26A protein [Polypterus senegalus]
MSHRRNDGVIQDKISVYDDQPNAHKRFMEKLDARIRNHDREIEKMCNFHHQGFVDAITELLKVRADAEKLMVTAQTEEMIRCRVQQRNIATTVEKLQLCIPVLEMYSKLKEQLESKRYYAALKTMEQLENVYIPRVGQYRFCQIMAETLPKLREEIKDISMSDLKDFLESIRKHSDKIGETAMKQAHQHRTFNSAVQKQANSVYCNPPYMFNGKASNQDNEYGVDEDYENDEEGYGFPVNRLFDLLFEIRDQYNETLLKKWAGVFREIFESDNYSPIPVENEEEYKSVISRFPFHDAEIEKQQFPKKLPMSQSVPQIYIQVKEFIYASLKFSESLHRSSTEIDDMLRKSTNLLLTRTLSCCLQNLIKKPHIGLTEIFATVFSQAALESYIPRIQEVVRSEESAVELIFAAYSTTASASTSLVLQLLKNPSVADKAAQELSSQGVICAEHSVPSSALSEAQVMKTTKYFNETSRRPELSLEKLDRLRYLDCVVKEVLRILPPVSGGYRTALQTFELDVAAVKLWEIYIVSGRDPTCPSPLPPGTMGIPFLGETLQMVLQRRKFLRMKRQKYGFIYKTHLFGSPTIRIMGAENVRQILLGEHKLVSVQWPASVRTILGSGTLSSLHDSEHRNRKKVIMRAFSREALEYYVPVIEEEVRCAVSEWLASGSVVLVYPEAKRLMFRIAMRILLGFEPEKTKRDEHELVDAFEEMSRNLFSLPIDVPFSGLYRGLKARNLIHAKIDENLKEKISNNNFDSQHKDALQLLIEHGEKNGERLSMQELKASATELLFGGHETTASAATSLVMFLGLHPEVVENVRKELYAKVAN